MSIESFSRVSKQVPKILAVFVNFVKPCICLDITQVKYPVIDYNKQAQAFFRFLDEIKKSS